ncbi:Uncharacterised protein [Mycobacteroides abscessus subsp. massiliense]|nr:Uncharacterised protein [Mycobacteroides abscessus subsp. massiliense]
MVADLAALRYEARSTRLMATPPRAPIAPATPINAPDMVRDHVSSSPALRALAAKTDGIILYTEPLPIPETTNRMMKPMT